MLSIWGHAQPEVITLSEFAAYLRQDVERSQRQAAWLPLVCKLSINLNYLIGPILAYIGTQGAFLFSVAGFMAMGCLNWSKRSDLLKPLPNNRIEKYNDITKDMPSVEFEIIICLCVRCGIDRQIVRVLSDYSSTRITPSVSCVNGTYYFILPQGFFDLWQAQPKTAEAMLAHECGHVLQRDVDLYLIFRQQMRFFTRVFFPMICAVVPILTFLSIIQLKSSAKSSASCMDLISSIFNDRMTRFSTCQHQTEAVIVLSLAVCALLLIVAILGVGLIYIFRRANWRSEATCDRIAFFLTGGAGIRAALSMPEFQRFDRRHFLTPSLAWRRKKLERMLALVRHEPSPVGADIQLLVSGSTASPPKKRQLKGIRRRGVIWVALSALLCLCAYYYVRFTPYVGEVRPQAVAWWPDNSWPESSRLRYEFNHDATKVATTNAWAQTVEIRSLAGKSPILTTIPTLGRRVAGIDFSPDDVLILIAFDTSEIAVYAVDTGVQTSKTIKVEVPPVATRFLGVDYIVVAGKNGSLSIWNPISAERVYHSDLDGRPPKVVEFSPDRYEVLFVYDDAKFAIFESLGFQKQRSGKFPELPSLYALSNDIRYLAYYYDESLYSIDLRDIKPDQILVEDPPPHAYGAERHTLAFSPNSLELLSEGPKPSLVPGTHLTDGVDQDPYLYRPPDWSREVWSKTPKVSHFGAVRWSSDGKFVVGWDYAGFNVKTFFRLSRDSEAVTKINITDRKPIALTALSPAKIAYVTDDGTVRIRDMSSSVVQTAAQFRGFTCIGVGVIPETVRVNADGKSAVMTSDGKVSTAEPLRACESKYHDRFKYEDDRLNDALMGWKLDFSDVGFGNLSPQKYSVMSAPDKYEYMDPKYIVAVIHDEDIVIYKLADSRLSKSILLRRLSIIWLIIVVLSELIIWNRRAISF